MLLLGFLPPESSDPEKDQRKVMHWFLSCVCATTNKPQTVDLHPIQGPCASVDGVCFVWQEKGICLVFWMLESVYRLFHSLASHKPASNNLTTRRKIFVRCCCLALSVVCSSRRYHRNEYLSIAPRKYGSDSQHGDTARQTSKWKLETGESESRGWRDQTRFSLFVSYYTQTRKIIIRYKLNESFDNR